MSALFGWRWLNTERWRQRNWLKSGVGEKCFGSDGEASLFVYFSCSLFQVLTHVCSVQQQETARPEEMSKAIISRCCLQWSTNEPGKFIFYCEPEPKSKAPRAAPLPRGSSRWHLHWQPRCVSLCGSIMRKATVETIVRPQTINRAICKSHLFSRQSETPKLSPLRICQFLKVKAPTIQHNLVSGCISWAPLIKLISWHK